MQKILYEKYKKIVYTTEQQKMIEDIIYDSGVESMRILHYIYVSNVKEKCGSSKKDLKKSSKYSQYHINNVLQLLSGSGLIYYQMSGRTKEYYITERGMVLLKRLAVRYQKEKKQKEIRGEQHAL